MDDIVLDNKRFTIFGLPGSGKTELAKYIIRSTDKYVVYDPLGANIEHHDFDGYRRYVPKDRTSPNELSNFIRNTVIPNRRHIRLFVVDEANTYVKPKPNRLPPGIQDLNDLSRHWGIAWGLIARRPSQFHTDVVELCHYLFVFMLPGKNDHRYLNSVMTGAGDAVEKLEPFQFLVIDFVRGHWYVHNPIPIDTEYHAPVLSRNQ